MTVKTRKTKKPTNFDKKGHVTFKSKINENLSYMKNEKNQVTLVITVT